MTQICATVIGRDVEAIRRARTAAEADADLVELRLDSMERPDAAGALAGRTKPAIATCRPLREGGLFDGSEEERLRVLQDADAHGAEFIDVEWDAAVQPLIAARGGRGTIVSRHVFDGMPADAAGILRQLRAAGGELIKLAVATEGLSDVRRLLEAACGSKDAIVIGLGPAGLATRVLAGRFGSPWTYAGNGVAPGQVPVDRLLKEFQFRRIRSDAAVYVLLGRPAAGSLSPAMHNAGFAALGLNAVYVPVETRDVRDFAAFAQAFGVRGAGVTIPFKRDAMAIADEMAPVAVDAGAVNTLTLRDGRWIGTNTDADGFLEPLRRRIPDVSGVRTTILGAGGAARAAGLALRRAGAEVHIAARRASEALAVAGAIGGTTTAWPPPARSWDVLVNATPVGSRSVPGTPIDGDLDGTLVYDLVYDPDPTPLMRAARDRGRTVIGGIEMLVAQAERQFEIWTGQKAPAGLFMNAARRAIEGRSA